LHLKVNDSLICFNGGKSIAWLNLISDLLVPLLDITLLYKERVNADEYVIWHELFRLTFSMVGDKLGISRAI